MGYGGGCEVALDHQDQADHSGFHGFVPTERSTELVLLVKQRLPIVACRLRSLGKWIEVDLKLSLNLRRRRHYRYSL